MELKLKIKNKTLLERKDCTVQFLYYSDTVLFRF